MENPIFKLLNINQGEQEQDNNINTNMNEQSANNNSFNDSSNNNLDIEINPINNINNNINNLDNNININMNNMLSMDNNINDNINNVNNNNDINSGINLNINLDMNNNMNNNMEMNMNMNNPMYYNQMGMNNFGMNRGMNVYSMFPMNQMINNNMSVEDQNLFRLKFLLNSIQQYSYHIKNDIIEVRNILNNMKNEGLDNNPNYSILRNRFNKILNNFNNNRLNIIFRKSRRNDPPIMIQVGLKEKMKDIIQRYKEKSNDFDDSNKFIFKAKNINLELTAEEIGLTNNCTIFVVNYL